MVLDFINLKVGGQDNIIEFNKKALIGDLPLKHQELH